LVLKNAAFNILSAVFFYGLPIKKPPDVVGGG